jgi:nucleoside-diphosphate-sugar epimerase
MTSQIKNILITGAKGFIGTELSKKLTENGHNVLEINRSDGCISKKETFNRLPKSDVLVHLAGLTSVKGSWENAEQYSNVNITGTLNALNYCKQWGAKLVFCSSYVYGVPKYLPIDESHPIQASNPYMLSKVTCESYCRLYNNKFGVKSIVLRPFNIYGKGQSDSLLLGQIIAQIKRSNKITLRNTDAKRDFIHVSDVIEAIEKAINIDLNFEAFNIGSGQSTSIVEILEMLQAYSEQRLNINVTDGCYIDPILDCYADVSKSKKILGWKPKVSLASGLRSMMERI